jgi:hypothetical protein
MLVGQPPVCGTLSHPLPRCLHSRWLPRHPCTKHVCARAHSPHNARKQAFEAMKSAKLPRCYYDVMDQMKTNPSGNTPYTPSLSRLYGLRESIK